MAKKCYEGYVKEIKNQKLFAEPEIFDPDLCINKCSDKRRAICYGVKAFKESKFFNQKKYYNL